MASTKFINECKNGANSNRLGKISVETIKKVSGTKLELSKTLDKKISPKLYGITKQETSTRSINYCPDIDKWGLNNEAYIENGYIVLPKNTANATSPLIPIDKQQYFWFAYAKVYTEIENNKLLCNTEYYDGDKKRLSGNGNAVSIGTVSVDNNYYWTFGGGSGTQYGQALYNAKYIRISFAYSSNYSNGAYKIKCPMITSERQPTFVPYVPNMPSPDYPSEIEVGRGKNLFDEKQLLETTGWSINSDGYYTGSAQDLKTKYGPTTDGFTKGIKFKNNTQYTITCDFYASVNNGNNRFHFEYTDGTNSDVSWNDTTSTKKIVTSTLGKTIKKICFNCNNNARIIYLKNIQLEKGSKATSYLPYNTIEVKSTGKNLFDLNKVTYTNSCTLNEDKSITYKAWASIFVNTENVLKMLKPNTTYTMSFDAEVLNKSSNITETRNLFLLYKPGKSFMLSNLNISNMNLGQKYNSISTFTTPSDLTDYRILSYSSYPSPYSTIKLSNIMLVEGDTEQEYEPYKESSITYDLGDNFLADKDYIENGVLNKNVRHLRLAIADMNNNDNYPGWKNVPYIGKDYPNQNDKLSNSCNYKSNITNTYVALNSLGGGSNLILFKTLFGGLTQTEIKEQYPDLILDLYYEMPQTEQIQLETTGELRTFEPNTIITNSLDSEMEVEYSSWDTEITNSDNLTDVSIEDSCYVDGQIIGTTYAKKATSQLIAIPNDVDLLDKKIKVEIGVKYADLSNEMIKMGNYTIERPKDEQTENFTQITAYDGFNLLDNPYVCNLDFSNDITIADFYIDVCNQLKLSPMKTTFLNSDIKVTANPFVNKETLRVVLQEIEKVSCTFSEIDYETNKIDLVWLSENEEPDYEFATSDYTTLEGGKITYGPVNCLVIKESQIEGENTVRQDDDSIKTNGETQIAIQDSYFLFTQALREQAIDNIWNRVKGLTYVDCKLTTSYGKPFLKVGKKIRVNVNDGRVFDTYVLKHTFKYDGTFESIIESPALTKQETKVKSKSISESIRLTEIRVDKAEGKITATTQKIQEVETDIKDNYYSKTNVNELIQTAETGVTNTFSEAGGNNILRNTGLWFESNDTDNPYEFWLGNVKKGKNDNAVGYNSMLLQNGTLEQEQEVPNGDYSISFYYQKLNQLCNASVVINDAEYPLESVEVKQFYTGEKDNETGEYIVQPIVVSSNHINIKFKCDADNGVEVYDLMCNKGSVKLAYSQNQNETTTDTVNISKGITITSSNDENVKFKADYDGIRTLNKNGDVKTRFTDKGMETDEAIIRYKEQTCGTLIQEVGDQTWFTRM